LALTSPTSGCRSVGIVRLRTKATEFSLNFFFFFLQFINSEKKNPGRSLSQATAFNHYNVFALDRPYQKDERAKPGNLITS
jgi:hypothetical protein